MVKLSIPSPFNAPVFHEEIVSSTMDVSRKLAETGGAHGTVIVADFQNAGRGRGAGRVWQIESKLNLPFTIMLRYPRAQDIPAALTLRTGLAAALAIEDFVPSLQGKVKVKWPNDIMIHSKKAVGILCEADGGTVHVGVGINVGQKEFSGELQEKATSIALASGIDFTPQERFVLLEKVLGRLYAELETAADWKPRLEQRLYKKGEQVTFVEGSANSSKKTTGILTGISEHGELLITPNGGGLSRSFTAGELEITR